MNFKLGFIVWALVLGVLGSTMQAWVLPNQTSRLYLTRAIVDQGNFQIGSRTMQSGQIQDTGPIQSDWGPTDDKAIICTPNAPDSSPAATSSQTHSPQCDGKLYLAKSPGISILATPLYALLWYGSKRFVDKPPSESLSLKYLAFFFGVIPCAFLFAFLFNGLSTSNRRLAPWLWLSVGSLLPVYAIQFTAHIPAAVSLFFALHIACNQTKSFKWNYISATCIGIACFVDYTSALVVPIWCWVSLSRTPFKIWITAAIAAAAPWAIGLGWYHAAVFGSPFELPYSHIAHPFYALNQQDNFGLGLPKFDILFQLFFSAKKGLLYFCPWLIFCIPGLIVALINKQQRTFAIAAFITISVFALYNSGLSNWHGGWSMGSRYFLPAVPLIVYFALRGVAVAVNAHRYWGLLSSVLGIVSVFNMFFPLLMVVDPPWEFTNPIFEYYFPLWWEGYHNSFLMQQTSLAGALEVIVLLLLIIGAGGVACQIHQSAYAIYRNVHTALAIFFATIILWAMGSYQVGMDSKKLGRYTWTKRTWEPAIQANSARLNLKKFIEHPENIDSLPAISREFLELGMPRTSFNILKYYAGHSQNPESQTAIRIKQQLSD